MAKSIAPQDAAQLIALLSQSGIMPPEQLGRARQLAGPAGEEGAMTSPGAEGEENEVSAALRRWVEAGLLSPWQAAQLGAGQFLLKLGTYQLINEPHAWEFGRAFHARHAKSGQDVTLKLLANRWLQVEETWKRATVQLRAAIQLQNPHLLPFTSVSRAAQRTFLVSQRAPGITVQQLLQRFGPPSVTSLRRIMGEAADGLQALHQANLTHGALRPSAISLTAEGTVQIVDLGLAPLAPDLHGLLRANLSSTVRIEPFPTTLLPPAEGLSGISGARQDVALLARLGLHLLETGPHPNSAATEEAPSWWREAGEEIDGTLDTLRSIFESAGTWKPDFWTAQGFLEAMKAPSSHGDKSADTPVSSTATSQPTTSQPTTSQPANSEPTTSRSAASKSAPPKPTEGQSSRTKANTPRTTPAKSTAKSAEKPPAQSRPATGAAASEKRPIVVDTQRRRRRLPADDERMAKIQRLHRRRASLLYVSVGMTLATMLLMAAVLLWPAEGIRLWSPTLASRPDDAAEEVPGEAEGKQEGRGAGEGGEGDPAFPEPGQLEFPTPDAFAAVQPEEDSTAAPSEPTPEEPSEPNDLASIGENDGGSPNGDDLAMAEPQASDEMMEGGAPASGDTDPPSPDEPPDMDLAEAATTAEPTDEPAETSETDPEPPAPTPPTQVLASLPSRVELPEPAEGGEDGLVTLTPLKLEPHHTLELTLLGGEHILKGNPILRLQHAEGGTAERKWDVMLVDRTGPPTPIARFDLEEEVLRFRWEPAGRKRTEAAQLMNCALSLALGTETHRLGLRQPVEAPAPTMNFAQGLTSIRWDIPHAPEATQCRLELISLEGPFPETRKYPSNSLNLSPTRQDYWIMVGEAPEDRGLTFRVETRARRQFELNITSLLFEGDTPPQQVSQLRDARINTANRRRWLAASQTRLQQATQRLAALNTINPNSAGARTSQQELARQKNLAEVDLETAKVDAARIETIEQWASSMHDVGKLHFRVYFEFAGNQVDLLRTAGADVEREL